MEYQLLPSFCANKEIIHPFLLVLGFKVYVNCCYSNPKCSADAEKCTQYCVISALLIL